MDRAWELLKSFPFSCRKAVSSNPFLGELFITFAGAGHVALFEIEDDQQITVLAVRHPGEEDCYPACAQCIVAPFLPSAR